MEGEDNFLELVDNKEGEEEDADNNTWGSGLLSIIRLGGRLILNTFRVSGTNSLKAGPVGHKNTICPPLWGNFERSLITWPWLLEAGPVGQKNTICPPTSVPDLWLLDSWTLAGVEVFDGGVDVLHDPADLFVLQLVHLRIICSSWWAEQLEI